MSQARTVTTSKHLHDSGLRVRQYKYYTHIQGGDDGLRENNIKTQFAPPPDKGIITKSSAIVGMRGVGTMKLQMRKTYRRRRRHLLTLQTPKPSATKKKLKKTFAVFNKLIRSS